MNAYERIIALGVLTMSLVSCGGGGGGGNNTASSPPPATVALAGTATAVLPGSANPQSNQLAVTVEQDPAVTAFQTVNLPYVTVTICDVNNNCQTIDHVVVDTGSYGLRILQSAITNPNMNLSSELIGSDPVAECTAFLDGFMWGSVNLATIQLSGEIATQIPVQVVGDSAVSGVSTPPTTCSNNGVDESNLNGIGGNGILGVGLFTADDQQYYTCTNGSCIPYGTPNNPILQPTQQVSNPVPSFSRDNNGVILQMPSVPDGGAGMATGTLTFGVGTQTDNSASGLQWLAADYSGNISVTLQDTTYGASFIDSGSNFYYVPLNNVPSDVNQNYTPAQPTLYPLSLTPNVGPVNTVPQNMLVVNPAQMPSSSLAMDDVDIDLGQTSGAATGSADLGMPFFYGKSLAFVINGQSAPGIGTGPRYGVPAAQ